MKSFRKISAILFLSIHSLVMLYTVLPHVHHEHEEFKVSFELSDHHDDGILGLLIEGHAHQYSITNVPVLSNRTNHKINVNDIYFSPFIVDNTISLDDYGAHLTTSTNYFPQNYNKHTYLTAFSFRGPPSLV
ncbi:MAG: hypothetical protein ACYCZ2_14140 [Lutibacter sp.]